MPKKRSPLRPIKVLLVDDQTAFTEFFHESLNRNPDFEVVEPAYSGADALRIADENEVDVAVVDVHMPEMDGVLTTTFLKNQHPEMKVLALTGIKGTSMAAKMYHAGATGFLLKTDAAWEITRAIRTVASGERYIKPDVYSDILQYEKSELDKKEREQLKSLTPREREVLDLLANEESCQDIADRFEIRVGTVHVYCSKLMSKLNIISMVALTKFAIRVGITSLD